MVAEAWGLQGGEIHLGNGPILMGKNPPSGTERLMKIALSCPR